MKKLSFKIKFDEEFKDYYFTPFKNDRDYYVWINDIFETSDGLYAITDDYGDIKVDKIDWDNMKVEVLV